MPANFIANAALDHPEIENRFSRSPEGAREALMHASRPMALARFGRRLEVAADARPWRNGMGDSIQAKCVAAHVRLTTRGAVVSIAMYRCNAWRIVGLCWTVVKTEASWVAPLSVYLGLLAMTVWRKPDLRTPWVRNHGSRM